MHKTAESWLIEKPEESYVEKPFDHSPSAEHNYFHYYQAAPDDS